MPIVSDVVKCTDVVRVSVCLLTGDILLSLEFHDETSVFACFMMFKTIEIWTENQENDEGKG